MVGDGSVLSGASRALLLIIAALILWDASRLIAGVKDVWRDALSGVAAIWVLALVVWSRRARQRILAASPPLGGAAPGRDDLAR